MTEKISTAGGEAIVDQDPVERSVVSSKRSPRVSLNCKLEGRRGSERSRTPPELTQSTALAKELLDGKVTSCAGKSVETGLGVGTILMKCGVLLEASSSLKVE